jgi:hypothetical protein
MTHLEAETTGVCSVLFTTQPGLLYCNGGLSFRTARFLGKVRIITHKARHSSRELLPIGFGALSDK